LIATADQDSLLGQLCGRSSIPCPDFERRERLLAAQIHALIQLHVESSDVDALFLRGNRTCASPLELAALTGKSKVAAYLALLHVNYDRDPNHASDKGHTVLHLLARKGDDAADALEHLLALRDDLGRRLLRIDVVNRGSKTPLDVVSEKIVLSFLYLVRRSATDIASADLPYIT